MKLFLKTQHPGVSSAARVAGSRAQLPPLLPQTPRTGLCRLVGGRCEKWVWCLNQVRALGDKATPLPYCSAYPLFLICIYPPPAQMPSLHTTPLQSAPPPPAPAIHIFSQLPITAHLSPETSAQASAARRIELGNQGKGGGASPAKHLRSRSPVQACHTIWCSALERRVVKATSQQLSAKSLPQIFQNIGCEGKNTRNSCKRLAKPQQ